MIKVFIFIFTLIGWSSILQAQNDIKGSQDHPLISRYPGSNIGYYDVKKYGQYNIALGPEKGYRTIDDWKKVEGKITRIYYTINGERSLTEIYRNFQTAIKKGEFETMAEGNDEAGKAKSAVGGRNFLGILIKENPLPTNADIKLLVGSATSGGTCYIAAKKTTANGTSYVVISGSKYSKDQNVFMLDIIEETQMEDDLITINADALKKALDQNGKVAIYAILFDVDKSDIKDESKPALEEIGKLLKNNPTLNLFVVGHTDLTGNFNHNTQLSEARAKAVVDYLVKNFGIKASRLSANGVGPLCPVSENKTEDGRRLNRRVELVKQNL